MPFVNEYFIGSRYWNATWILLLEMHAHATQSMPIEREKNQKEELGNYTHTTHYLHLNTARTHWIMTHTYAREYVYMLIGIWKSVSKRRSFRCQPAATNGRQWRSRRSRIHGSHAETPNVSPQTWTHGMPQNVTRTTRILVLSSQVSPGVQCLSLFGIIAYRLTRSCSQSTKPQKCSSRWYIV